AFKSEAKAFKSEAKAFGSEAKAFGSEAKAFGSEAKAFKSEAKAFGSDSALSLVISPVRRTAAFPVPRVIFPKGRVRYPVRLVLYLPDDFL
ncbi:MAG: hypothetical protein LBF78_15370, partial [Treponema sp.]|nr:hypothetical protein [Treponema sp.]